MGMSLYGTNHPKGSTAKDHHYDCPNVLGLKHAQFVAKEHIPVETAYY